MIGVSGVKCPLTPGFVVSGLLVRDYPKFCVNLLFGVE